MSAEGIVLLKNDNSLLPLDAPRPCKVLVTGPNVKSAVVTGGGCAEVRFSWAQTPWEGLLQNKPESLELDYTLGCEGQKFMQLLNEDFTCVDGVTSGFNLRHYSRVDGRQAETPVLDQVWHVAEFSVLDPPDAELTQDYYTEIEAIFTAPITGNYEFGLVVTGRGWLYLDGQLVIDNSDPATQIRGGSYFGNGTSEVKSTAWVKEGKVSRTALIAFELLLTRVAVSLSGYSRHRVPEPVRQSCPI